MNHIDAKLERLINLIGYLIYTGKLSIKSIQSDIAKAINANNVSVSRALNGTKNYLTDDFIKRINNAFGNPFNTEWIINGIGEKINNTNSINNKDCSLYHYTTAESLLKILENRTLKFSYFNDANDPKERMLYKHFENLNEGIGEKEAKEMLKHLRFISFCEQPSSRYNESQKKVTLPRMWAQYGTKQDKDGKNKKSFMNGACIEFDKEKMIAKAEKDSNGELDQDRIKGLSFFRIEYKKDTDFKSQYLLAKSFFEVPEKNYYLRGQKHYVKKSSPTSSGIIAIITEYSCTVELPELF
jgi:hypothetical protein